ncbi:hypothetical protein QVD17_36943 [Tagetes erecta]|uniref:Cupin type-1 domain-containing protein n=1 Tax=Tagetes erecta TaxID=13708 RepID=A0AAD8JVL8_TARER|nr:hypothetical protein QVD17_36943 [Tagetes erecta]
MRTNVFSICLVFSAYIVFLHLILPHGIATTVLCSGGGATPVIGGGPTVRKDERWRLVWSEFGEISTVKISSGMKTGCYHLHFITMDPHSLFLPAYLYSEMVLFVNSGNGTLSWIEVDKDEHELQQLKLETGDIHTLQPHNIFYLQNNLEADDPQDLQIYAIFFDSQTDLRNQEFGRVYAGVHDLMLRFDNTVLQAALNVSEEVIQELRGGESQPLIVLENDSKTNTSTSEVGSRVLKALLRTQSYDIFDLENKKKKDKKKKKKDKKKKDKKEKEKEEIKTYNIFKADHDVENPHGWSVTANNKQLDHVSHVSDFSVFMVNLTEGSMMGPHWNPTSEEIAIVLRGQGMVQVVCPSVPSETGCKGSRFRVEEGDVFMVPRYHPMAQMSYSNKSFVFMGFTMTSENNSTQYLAGDKSILQTLDKTVLAESFDVRNTTLADAVLSGQKESIFLECKSCAEDEQRLMEEEGVSGGGWQEADIEGEIARGEELEMRRRLRKAEEAAARRRKVTEKGGS